MTAEVPLGVEGVADRPGRVALGPHGQLTVRVTLTWGEGDHISGSRHDRYGSIPQRPT